MRILWITNMLLPDIAEAINGKSQARKSGTWLDNWLNSIKNIEDIQLAIACVNGKNFVEKSINNVMYYLIPGNGKTMLIYHPTLVKYWEQIEKSFKPDIVHIHGTEYTHPISYIRRYPDKRYVISIQGLLGPISREYYGGISAMKTYAYRTMQEWLKASGTVGVRRIYQHNIKYENEMIEKAELAIGRYDFDKFYVQSINPEIKYARCNYSLREEFYLAKKWDILRAEKHTIYAGAAASTPLKGGHVLLKAIEIVKRKYPDVKIVFVGVGDSNGSLKCSGGYKYFLKNKIEKYGLSENVEFLPILNANEIINAMLRSYCTVVPSAMDNGSTMLREAMHLGLPAIASFRGGLTGLLKDGESGFYFDFPEYTFLAGRIIQLFEDRNLAIKFSENSINIANTLHDKKQNSDNLVSIYRGFLCR